MSHTYSCFLANWQCLQLLKVRCIWQCTVREKSIFTVPHLLDVEEFFLALNFDDRSVNVRSVVILNTDSSPSCHGKYTWVSNKFNTLKLADSTYQSTMVPYGERWINLVSCTLDINILWSIACALAPPTDNLHLQNGVLPEIRWLDQLTNLGMVTFESWKNVVSLTCVL